MDILKFLIPILSAILLTGCCEDFDPKIDTKPVVCINSVINAGQPIDVNVSRSWKYNDLNAGANHSVEDAVVNIFANGNRVNCDYIPTEGDVVSIAVESPVYGSASAEVTVPHAVPIGNVKATVVVTDIRYGDVAVSGETNPDLITFNLDVEMDLTDIPDIDNYYEFGYIWDSSSATSVEDPWNFQEPILTMGNFEYDIEPIFTEHVSVVESVMGTADYSRFNFFTDRQFAGETYTLHLVFTDNKLRPNDMIDAGKELECGVKLLLFSVSPGCYNWAVYKWNADNGFIGDLSDIGLAEPKWGYSNVSTGAGLVAAKSVSDYRIDLYDLLRDYLR